MATAKIPLPLPPAPKKRTKQPPAPEPISPDLVGAPCRRTPPTRTRYAVSRASPKFRLKKAGGRRSGSGCSSCAAGGGTAAGGQSGRDYGTAEPEVLQRGEALWLVAMAAVIGLFVEKLVGNTAHSLMASAATASEKRDAIEVAEPFPTMRSGWRVAFFLLVITVLTVAIATVDALGLHMLYEERQLEAQLTGAAVVRKYRCGSSSSRGLSSARRTSSTRRSRAGASQRCVSAMRASPTCIGDMVRNAARSLPCNRRSRKRRRWLTCVSAVKR